MSGASPAGHADHTVTFTFEGVQYSLPLAGNTGKIRRLMLPWIEAGCSHEDDSPPRVTHSDPDS
jgi:hypothetical protein